METSLATSATYDGVTFNFDREVQVGYFMSGSPVVISDQDFEITSITPASDTTNSFKRNGAVINPYISNNSAQGFDQMIASAVSGAARFGNTPYDNALNVDPGNTGSNIVVAAGTNSSIVKAVRLASVTTPESWQTVEKYVTLTILSEVPPFDAYVPSASALTKTIYRRANVNRNVLRSLTMPASFTATASTAAAKIPSSLGLFGSTGEHLRRFRLDVATGGSTTNYSAQLAKVYVDYLNCLHDSDTSDADRTAIIDKVIEFGIQIAGLRSRGYASSGTGTGGAGQGLAIHPWYWYTAFLLQDASMLADCQAMNSGTVSLTKWITSADVGQPAPGKSGKTAQTFFSEHVNVPHIIPDEFASNHDSRYGAIAASGGAHELLSIQALRNGPGGVDGAAAVVNGSFGTSNQRASAIAHVDRVRQWSPWPTTSYDVTDEFRDLYDLIKPLASAPAWTGRPDQVPNITNSFTAGSGSISWDFTGLDYATEAVTSRDMRYSLDGVQWIVESGVNLTGTKTGLLQGVQHWCGFRQNSASGNGIWSANYPVDLPITSGTDRNRVTTTGSETAAAPVFTVNPAIHSRLHPSWGGPSWVPASGTLSDSQVELSAGIGYYTGSIATATYQWKRDGVDISGATSKTYTRVAADAGTELTCVVTLTNGSGSTSFTTAGVTAPTIATLPATKLIDTDFRWPFIIEYESQWNAATTSNATKVHLPTEGFTEFPTIEGNTVSINSGAILCDKTGSFPNLMLPLKNNAIAGKTYRVSGQIVGSYPDSNLWNADGFARIYNAANAIIWEVALTRPSPNAPFIVNFDQNLVVGPSETDLTWRFRISVQTATGSTPSGDVYLTQLTIEEV